MKIIGTDGPDLLTGTSNHDRITGLAGSDELRGRGASDDIFGDAGSDALFGARGADFLYGGADADYLSGGRGNDLLAGGLGDDILVGGKGRDTFSFAFSTLSGPVVDGHGADTIADFRSGKDTIAIVWGEPGATAEYDASTGQVSVTSGADTYVIAKMAKGLTGVDIDILT